MPVDLIEGWNLIGIHGAEDKNYNAKSLLDAMYNQQEIRSDSISRWLSQDQDYSVFHYDPEIKKYSGENFEINNTESYLIRVTEGDGVFNP
jgi:hypothetical protein